jgi:hypothetical protein
MTDTLEAHGRHEVNNQYEKIAAEVREIGARDYPEYEFDSTTVLDWYGITWRYAVKAQKGGLIHALIFDASYPAKDAVEAVVKWFR